MMTTSQEENSNKQPQFTNSEEEEKYYKKENDKIMNDTLDSSRRILKKLDKAEQIAVNNMNILAEDEERLQRINANLMNINDKTDRVNQHITQFNKYNKSYLLPSFDFTTEEGNQKKDKKLLEKTNNRKEEAKAKSDQNIQRIQNDINNAYSQNGTKSSDSDKTQSSKGKTFLHNKDHAAAQEIEENLDKASDSLQKLKLMALSMNQTINEQNELITNKIVPNVEISKSKINAANQRIEKIKN